MKNIIYIMMALLLCSFATAGSLQDPSLYLSFNNVTNDIYPDASANADDFTEIDTTRLLTGCKIGGCVNNDGVGPNRLSVEIEQAIADTDDVGSFSFWINTSTNNVYKAIFNNRQFNDFGEFCSIVLGVDQGKLMMDVAATAAECSGDRDQRDFWRGPTINDGIWHHVVWASDGIDYWVYLDGVKQTLTSVPVGTIKQGRWFNEAPYDNSPTQMLGYQYDDINTYNLDASLDEFAYYNFNMTGPATNCTADNTSQVCLLYNGGSGWVPINLSVTVTANATLLPAVATNATQLTGMCNVSLSIGAENVTLDASWKKNGITTFTYYNLTTLITPQNVNLTTVPATNLTPSDTWQFLCRATRTDNHATSGWVESSIVTIGSTQKTAFMFKAQNAVSGSIMQNVLFNVTNTTYGNSSISTTSDWTRVVVPAGGVFNISATFSTNPVINTTQTVSLGGTTFYTFILGGIVTANIYDEAKSGINGSNVPFNVSGTETLDFILYCNNNETRISSVTSFNYPFLLDCDYRKFELFATYATSGTDFTYYRRFIESPTLLNATGSFNVYMADFNADTIVRTTFKIIDYSNTYKDVKVVVKKTINNETVIISADYAGSVGQNSAFAFLLLNEEYIISVESSNRPTIDYGFYSPPGSETIFLNLFELSLDAIPTGVSGAEYTSWTSNSTGTLMAYLYYNDTDDSTVSLNWSVYINNTNGQFVGSQVSTSNDMILAMDVSLYENATLVTKVVFDRPVSISDYVKTIHSGVENKITLPLKTYFGSKWFDWIITILLGVILLYGTKVTAPLTIMGVGLMALTFKLFGWYSLHLAIIALIILIGLGLLLKKGEQAE